jgi:phosphoserine phosphatase RsbU/P
LSTFTLADMPDGPWKETLSSLLAVTDLGVTRLDVDDLLVEVLDRLRSILDADTAAVLLRQEGADELVARAAVGLEEEVRQGVRVPIGTGFAGTIAARKAPVVLDRVDATTVANPILWEKGIRRMLGVPLMVGTDVIGVLHVGRLDDRSFTSQDADLLQVAAERVAAAIQVRRLAVEAAAAALLERGLLPTRLPRLREMQFAARYAPAEDRAVGGDWYDAFVLPSEQLWVVIGDVAGHGLNSAVIMSRVKSALRAYALLGEGPARVLELTNRKVDHFEIGTTVTALCAVARPPYDRFEISSAGHPPPVLAVPGGGADLLALRAGPPLGALPEFAYGSAEFDLPPGGVLLCYTDGLIERRDEPIDTGLARLRAAVTAEYPEVVCREVMRRLVGATQTFDDVAVLALRRVPAEDAADGRVAAGAYAAADTETSIGQLRLAPDSQSVAQARAFVVQAAGELSPEDRSTLGLLASEVATNCVVHARSDFTIDVFRSPSRLRVEFTDYGAGAVTVQRAAPSDVSGRGMYFVAELSDAWGVRPSVSGVGKTVWFSVRLPAPVPTPQSSMRFLERQPTRQRTPSMASATSPDNAAVPVLTLTGDVDVTCADEVVSDGEQLLHAAASGGRIVIDLGRVNFFDSSGVAALLRLRRIAAPRGIEVALRDVPNSVALLLRMAGLEELFPTG